MSLVEASEPLFQYMCRLNRSARKGAPLDLMQVRSEVKALLQDCKARAMPTLKAGSGEWDKTEIILVYFIDFMIKQSKVPWARDWKELAHERGQMAGDEDFFDELDKTLLDSSDAATERLGIFYVCMGLGFTGWFTGNTIKLRQYMAQMASRLRGTMDADRAAKICPEAYENVNTADLVEPPSRKIVAMVIAMVGLAITVAAVNVVFFTTKRGELKRSLDQISQAGRTPDGSGKDGN